jgi:hypothetical protein
MSFSTQCEPLDEACRATPIAFSARLLHSCQQSPSGQERSATTSECEFPHRRLIVFVLIASLFSIAAPSATPFSFRPARTHQLSRLKQIAEMRLAQGGHDVVSSQPTGIRLRRSLRMAAACVGRATLGPLHLFPGH